MRHPLNEILTLSLRELEANPQKVIDNLPSLEDGYISMPAWKDGQYGTERISLEGLEKVEDDGSNPGQWNVENQIPEGWTVYDEGNGAPSMEAWMVEMMHLPVPPKKREKPQGF
jgi:hypothetical protein